MDRDSPYAVLGVEPDADEAELKAAYRRRVMETHPDQGGSVEELRLVRAAYEALTTGDDGGTAPAGSEPTEPTVDFTESVAEADTGPVARVEYLNYAVLDDHGWDLDDAALFEKAADADLDPIDHGRFAVEADETLLEAAEHRGFAWPFACRGGACANCAVAVLEGEVAMPVNHVLPEELTGRGFRLSCNAVPLTDELRVVYNVKHLPGLDELRLPPYPFERAYADG